MKTGSLETHIGRITVVVRSGLVERILFGGQYRIDTEELLLAKREDSFLLDRAIAELEEYVQGNRTTFTLPFQLKGTDWQRAVWREIATIAYGRTESYGAIARKLGGVGRARAVGMAAGANPLPLLIPCHRVIGADGSLTGFSSGLEIKRKLLAMEKENGLKTIQEQRDNRYEGKEQVQG